MVPVPVVAAVASRLAVPRVVHICVVIMAHAPARSWFGNVATDVIVVVAVRSF